MVRGAVRLFTGKSEYEKKDKKNISNRYGNISSESLCVVLCGGTSGETGGKQNVLGSSIYYNLFTDIILCLYMGCRFGKRKGRRPAGAGRKNRGR